MLFNQGITAQDFFQVIGVQGTFDYLVELVFYLRRFAVANGLDEQILQGSVLEGLA